MIFDYRPRTMLPCFQRDNRCTRCCENERKAQICWEAIPTTAELVIYHNYIPAKQCILSIRKRTAGSLAKLLKSQVIVPILLKDKTMDCTVHSKNSRVRFDPEKSPRGPDPFWGQTYPQSRSDWPGIWVRKDILDSDSGNFYPDSRSVWPTNGSGPMGPFSGSNLTREFLECRNRVQIRPTKVEMHKKTPPVVDTKHRLWNHATTSPKPAEWTPKTKSIQSRTMTKDRTSQNPTYSRTDNP